MTATRNVQITTNGPRLHLAVRQTLKRSQKDRDFDSVCVNGALAKLVETERAVRQKYWAEAETLL
jgi:hypothetical protein